MKFYAGDKVRVKWSCSGTEAGKIYTLRKYTGGTLFASTRQMYKSQAQGCSCQENWILVSLGSRSKKLLSKRKKQRKQKKISQTLFTIIRTRLQQLELKKGSD